MITVEPIRLKKRKPTNLIECIFLSPRGVTSDDVYFRNLGEQINYISGKPVAENLLLRIVTQIIEGKNSNRGFFRYEYLLQSHLRG